MINVVVVVFFFLFVLFCLVVVVFFFMGFVTCPSQHIIPIQELGRIGILEICAPPLPISNILRTSTSLPLPLTIHIQILSMVSLDVCQKFGWQVTNLQHQLSPGFDSRPIQVCFYRFPWVLWFCPLHQNLGFLKKNVSECFLDASLKFTAYARICLVFCRML